MKGESKRASDRVIAIIGFLTALTSLLTAIAALCKTIEEGRSIRRETSEIRSRLGALEACKEAWIQIHQPAPQNGARVRGRYLNLEGSADIENGCRWAYVFLRKLTPTGQPYYVSEQIQVEENGNWRGAIDLDLAQVPSLGEFEIHARLTRSPESYQPLHWLGRPPEFGVSSSTIKLVRDP